MTQTSLTFSVRKRWFFWPAAATGVVGVGLGLIRDVPSNEHEGGVKSALDRVIGWLADHAVCFETA